MANLIWLFIHLNSYQRHSQETGVKMSHKHIIFDNDDTLCFFLLERGEVTIQCNEKSDKP